MKSLFFATWSVVLLLAFTACKNDKAADATDAAATQPTTTAPATAATGSGVEHYTCPNGHVGYGSDTAGSCKQCGTTLEHNQAFHANDAAATPNIQMNPPTGDMGAPAVQATPPAAPSAPQNAAGVWHYTCAKGCAGGAGEAVACTQCGSPLQHNQAYHN
jgi:hypothetical protein